MAYLNPRCADCMARNGLLWRQLCRARMFVNNCPNGYHSRYERELVVIQDTQKMPRDSRNRIRTRIDYTNTRYY